MLPKLLGVAACAVALTLAGPTPTHAASRSFVDGPGDVWTVSNEPERVDREQGDILRTTFTHRLRYVVVRTRFVQLAREGHSVVIFTQLRTHTGQVRRLLLEAGRFPETNRWRGKTVLERRNGRRIECSTGHSLDYASDVAVVRVPRACLDNPRTLEAKFGVATSSVGGVFVDNPINRGPTERLPRYTAPVRSG